MVLSTNVDVETLFHRETYVVNVCHYLQEFVHVCTKLHIPFTLPSLADPSLFIEWPQIPGRLVCFQLFHKLNC